MPTEDQSRDERERNRQAAYLYSIIQSAEESEDGGPETAVEKAYDAGIMYAARAVLENWAGDNDWTVDLYEYADEIRSRSVPGTPLPAEPPVIAYHYVGPWVGGRELVLDPRDVTIVRRAD